MLSMVPGCISYVLIYELPWLFNQIWRLVSSWLDEEARRLVKFANKDTITDLIDVSHLPDYMGGLNAKNYRRTPKEAIPFEDMASQFDLKGKDVKKIAEHFEKLSKID